MLKKSLILNCTLDIHEAENTKIATFAEDVVVISLDENTRTASENLQDHLNLLSV